MKTCCVEGCKNEDRAKGYCRTHYQQILTHGKIIVFECKERIKKPLSKRDKICTIINCENKQQAKGMCSKHYTRDRIHGSPDVNYRKKSKDKPLKMMREEQRYRLNADEVDFLSGLFKESVGINEGENCFAVD